LIVVLLLSTGPSFLVPSADLLPQIYDFTALSSLPSHQIFLPGFFLAISTSCLAKSSGVLTFFFNSSAQVIQALVIKPVISSILLIIFSPSVF
jgi:hypothetical protein